MTKCTTIALDDAVYEKLVKESLSRNGTARKISRVVNDLVEESITVQNRDDLLKLIYSKKLAKTSAAEFGEI
jgi:type III secretory pathway component EscV